jgi:hypothetical protein
VANTGDRLVEQLKAQLDHWNDEVGKLEAKAREAGAEDRAGIDARLRTLRGHREQTKYQLGLLQAGSEATRL